MTPTDVVATAREPKSAVEAAFSGELREALGFGKQDLVAIAMMARQALTDGDAALAFRSYALLVLVDPQTLSYQIGLAESALAAEAPDAALQAASAIVATQPDNPQGYFLSGRACMALGLLNEAREDLTDAANFAKSARLGDLFGKCQALLDQLA